MNLSKSILKLGAGLGLLCSFIASPDSWGAPESSWNLNDVSILFPLPSGLADSASLKTTTLGKGGELFPKAHFDLLPLLAIGLPQSEVYEQLRVVGVRMDPCFPGVPASDGCRNQIRLVWQPVIETPPDSPPRLKLPKVYTLDAALHTFHDLTQEEFLRFMRALKALKLSAGVSTAGMPLGIHPALSSQGLHGKFGTEFRKQLLTTIGQSNLTQFTYMTVRGRQNIWDFGGFEIKNGKTPHIMIPRLNGVWNQVFINGFFPTDFRGGARPQPEDQPDLFNTLMIDSQAFKNRPQDEVKLTIDSIHRIENPGIHSPATLDCVSCHVAQPARLWMERTMAEARPGESSSKFQSPDGTQNLSNPSPRRAMSNVIRAFGFFEAEPAINQRTIHESAAVASKMNQIAR